MIKFEKLAQLRNTVSRSDKVLCSATRQGEDTALHILWLYPDILNLHGGRGDVMALLHVSNLLGLPVEIRRCDNLSDEIPFDWAHMICMNSGELRCISGIIAAIQSQRDGLERFLQDGGMLLTVGVGGAVLADRTELLDGSTVKGLGLLSMTWREQNRVWGDDLWFAMPDGLEAMGNQIQVADIFLGEGQAPLGKTIYGRGNHGDGDEGARRDNIIFTNCLGPLLVKNPKVTAQWIKEAAEAAGIFVPGQLKGSDIEIENKSFDLIKKFIEKKASK